ncbi:MAG: hypothetical protein QXP38_03730, partial [Nitrososphaerota archaeon]
IIKVCLTLNDTSDVRTRFDLYQDNLPLWVAASSSTMLGYPSTIPSSSLPIHLFTFNIISSSSIPLQPI